MRKTLTALLCIAALLATLCVPSLAADPEIPAAAPEIPASSTVTDLPEKQGDFYLLLNGAFVTFTDALPQIRDDRSFLPFRTTFEAMGLDQIEWVPETSTAKATKDDLTVAVNLGEKSIQITKDGVTTTVDTDVAPYIDPETDRTYIPVGLIGKALDGFNAGWDATVGAVILDNIDALLESNEETYTLIDQYTQYASQYERGNWSADGSYNMAVAIKSNGASAFDSQPKDITLRANGTYKSVYGNNDGFQFNTDLTFDGNLPEEDLGGYNVTLPLDMNLDMRGSASGGVWYFYSKGLSELIANSMGMQPVDTWYKINLAKLWEEDFKSLTGIGYEQLYAMSRSTGSFSGQLRQLLKRSPLTSVSAPTSVLLASLNAVLGDSAFVKQDDGSYVNDLSALLGESGTMKIVFTSTDETIDGIELVMDADLSAPGIMTLTLKLGASQKAEKMNFSVSLDFQTGSGAEAEAVSLTLSMDGTYTPSETAPEILPPAGAPLLDLAAFL